MTRTESCFMLPRRFVDAVSGPRRAVVEHHRGTRSELPRPTCSLGPCGPRSLLEGGALAQRRCVPQPRVVRESVALSSSRKAQSAFRTTWARPGFLLPSTTRAGAFRPSLDRRRGSSRRFIPGVLALHPQAEDGNQTRSRSSFPGVGRDAIAPRVPVHSWHLPTPARTRTAVPQNTAHIPLHVYERACSLPCRSRRSRLRKGAPRYRMLNPGTAGTDDRY